MFWIAVIVIAILYFVNRSNSSRGERSLKATSPYDYNGQTAKIVATKGLKLRSQPNSSGMVLLTVPYNETVGIVDENGASETISGRTEKWYKVDYKGTIGWVWSGYLETQ